MNTAPTQPRGHSRTPFLIGGSAFVVLAAVIVIGVLRPEAFVFGYLSGFLMWFGLPMGAAALLMIHHLCGGRWGWSIRPQAEAALLTLPLVALALIPELIGAKRLYPWMTHAFPEGPEFAFRRWYLNVGFFYLRAVAFLAIWIGGGLMLLLWSRRRQCWDAAAGGGLRAFSAIGLMAYFLTTSFAGVDWFLTLEQHFYSSIFGLYIIIGQGLTAMAVFVLLSRLLRPEDRDRLWTPDRLNDIGTLLVTFIALHAYMAYSQYFIIWNGNLPHHAAWYAPRMRGAWGVVAVCIMAFHFLLPMFALFFKTIKRDARRLSFVAVWILAARMLDSVWMVLPSSHGGGVLGVVVAVASILGLGGLWCGAILWSWRRLTRNSSAATASPDSPKEATT